MYVVYSSIVTGILMSVQKKKNKIVNSTIQRHVDNIVCALLNAYVIEWSLRQQYTKYVYASPPLI